MKAFRPIRPGEMINEEMGERGWTVDDLAGKLGLTHADANRLLDGALCIGASLAERLSRTFGTSERLWITLESRYRADQQAEAGASDE